MTVSFAHTANSLNLLFTSTLNEGSTNESFGFADVKVTFCSEKDGDCAEVVPVEPVT